jgi:nitroreductase
MLLVFITGTFLETLPDTIILAPILAPIAANIGIDSCPIEGFEKDNVEKVLGLDTTKFQVAIILPFGYRVNEQSKQLRSSFQSVIEFIN